MKSSRSLQLMSAVLLGPIALVCLADEIHFDPNSPVAPGQRVVLSVPVSSGVVASYSWEATSGRFDGSTGRARVNFIAPMAGSAAITCIEEISGKKLIQNRTLLIAQATSGAAGRTEQTKTNAAANDSAVYDVSRGGFVPSGWMGDGEKKSGFSTDISEENPHRSPNSRRWVYRPQGSGWGAVAYQFPAGNWGDKEGRNLSGKGYRELSVWAHGVPDKNGRYPVIQFKAGGGSDPAKKYQASFEVEGDFVTLTGDWTRYTVNLGKNLSSVISAFTFVLRSEDNPNGATFFLSEIEYR